MTIIFLYRANQFNYTISNLNMLYVHFLISLKKFCMIKNPKKVVHEKKTKQVLQDKNLDITVILLSLLM